MKRSSAVLRRVVLLISLVLMGLPAACGSEGQSSEELEVAASATFGELRAVKGTLTFTAPGEQARAPYPRERLVEGAQVSVPQGGLAWLRRDGGATWLVSGPAKLTTRASVTVLESGRAFIDSEMGQPVQLETPLGQVELSDARASVEVDGKGASVYVLRGAARSGDAKRAGAGERLLLAGKGKVSTEAVVAWEDWTGGLATADPAAEPAPFGIGTVGARDPGKKGKPRFSLVVQRLDVRVTVTRDFAVTEVDQTFVNPSSDTVEGIFSFRTPPGAILSRFGVDRDGGLVWGRVKEMRAAQRQYESNVYAGSKEDPALLQWAAKGLYKARFYPIAPGARRRIVTRYSEWLPRHGPEGKRRLYVYPMAAEGARASLPRIEELRFSLDLTRATASRVRVGMGGTREGDKVIVKAYDFVPRADLAVELFDGGPKEVVAYRAPHALGPEDVPEDADEGFSTEVSNEEADYLAVPLRHFEEAAPAPEGVDLGIVIDTSAATEPGALAIARSMATSLLAHLGPNDRAALWAGDASLRPVAKGSGELQKVDAKKVDAWLAGLASVERGGATDLGSLLTRAAGKLDPKRRGAILYIGDGQPSVGELAPKPLRERLARLPASTRVLAAAVGTDANVALLQSLARGAPVEPVADAYGAARAALRLLEAAGRPAWLQAEVDLGPGIERVLPRNLPPISPEKPQLVVGRIRGDLPDEMTVKAEGGSVTRPISVVRLDDKGDLRKRWGEERLAELTSSGAGRASLVELARRFGLVSPFTSLYVATKAESRGQDQRYQTQLEAHKRRLRWWKPWARWRDEFDDEETEQVAEESADNKEGGTGTRAKGDEGAMGKATSATANKRYAVRGPARRARAMTGEPAPPSDDAPAAAMPMEEKTLVAEAEDLELLSAGDVAAPSTGALKPGSGGGLGLSGIGRGGGGKARARPEPKKVAGPKGSAAVGGAAVTGGGVSNASRVVAGMRAGFRACYNRGLATTPNAQGNVRLTLRVGPGGEVQSVTAAATGTLPSSVVACVRSRASAAQFAPPTAGTATITVPVTFGTGDDVRAPKPEPAKSEAVPVAAPRVAGIGRVGHQPRPCGPGADVPLTERVVLWRERLVRVYSPTAALTVYQNALSLCEAARWNERSRLLVEIVAKLGNIGARVNFWRELLKVSPAAADVVYRSMMLRVQTAADLKAAHEALGLKRIDATMLEALLKKAKSPSERLSLLRGAAERFPDDTELALVVLDAYEDAGEEVGGRAWARRLRRRVDATSHVRTNVGEYYLRLSARGEGEQKQRDAEEGRRTFGELVEFAPEDPLARRRLGDLLRAHGWYEEAFRQYETLATLTPDDSSVPLLLAAAAQGMGKVEEAVRWTEKAASVGSPDGSSPIALAARAHASAFLSWARLESVAKGKKEEASRLQARAARLASGERSKETRFVLTWAHPELRPALWTRSLGSPMPAPDNLPLYGVAQAYVATAPSTVEVRLDREDAARAARLNAKAVLTAVVQEGTDKERIAHIEVGFRDAEGKPREHVVVRFEGGKLSVVEGGDK